MKNNDYKRVASGFTYADAGWVRHCVHVASLPAPATFSCLQLQLEASRLSASPAIETIIVLPRHNWTIASENTNYKQPHDRLFIGCQVVKSCL